ncbi:hypothetical protein [Micromonospora purpureochromogenes]|uniref:hypothetical protein n=1 Tax=Micromonospora purpureochromogenes TaxID=47872 RepID=UPI0012FD40AB|nr:hypothetical protein [Micromonospora purpureochromogenes]
MGSSFTNFRGHGFWARDGLLEVWLEALAEVVPTHAPAWLQDAQRHWRKPARIGFQGCIDADLDALLTSQDRVAVALRLVNQAEEHLNRLASRNGRIPAAWLNERRVGGSDTWTGDLDLQPLRQITNAFAALIHGDLRTTATTSPVLPRPASQQP